MTELLGREIRKKRRKGTTKSTALPLLPPSHPASTVWPAIGTHSRTGLLSHTRCCSSTAQNVTSIVPQTCPTFWQWSWLKDFWPALSAVVLIPEPLCYLQLLYWHLRDSTVKFCHIVISLMYVWDCNFFWEIGHTCSSGTLQKKILDFDGWKN